MTAFECGVRESAVIKGIYTITGEDYTAAKKYPDALFQFEWSDDDNMFLDKSDIDTVNSQPFVPYWFGNFKSHLRSARLNQSCDGWTLA